MNEGKVVFAETIFLRTEVKVLRQWFYIVRVGVEVNRKDSNQVPSWEKKASKAFS